MFTQEETSQAGVANVFMIVETTQMTDTRKTKTTACAFAKESLGSTHDINLFSAAGNTKIIIHHLYSMSLQKSPNTPGQLAMYSHHILSTYVPALPLCLTCEITRLTSLNSIAISVFVQKVWGCTPNSTQSPPRSPTDSCCGTSWVICISCREFHHT